MNKTGRIFLLVLLIVVAIGGFLIYSGKINLNKQTSQPSPISDETASWKTYVSERLGYSIKIPPEYSFKEGDQNNYWEQFYLPKNDGSENDYWEKQVVVWDINTSDTDPCNPNIDLNKFKDFMEMKCVSINDITFRAVDVKQQKSRSKNYVYVTIYKGKNYSIGFTNVELNKREQIISTFKFTR